MGIDLDHFLVARLNGGWEPVRRVLRDPAVVLVDQDAVFEDGEVFALQRLLSHAVLGGVAVAALVPVSAFLAAFTALVCYAHLLADLLHDVRNLDRYLREHARLVAE